jgi:long-chain acyl-CoA synthetase
LTTDDDEITPTMKLKRSFVSKKFAKEIDAMY